MALLKSKTLRSGASGDYWKITSIICDKCSLKAKFVIALFVGRDFSIANSPSILKKEFSGHFSREQLQGNLTTLGYTAIKAKANTMLSMDISGNPCDPYPFDSDLFEAIDV